MDNTTLPGTGEVYASEDRGGVHWQKLLIEAGDTQSCDAFGRWRVSSPTAIFESKLLAANKQEMIWSESAAAGTSSSTPTAARPYIDITSTNATADTFVRQTFRRFNYQPGKSQLIVMTGVLELASGTLTGVERRIGYFDDDNGAFFESNAGVIGVTVRSNDTSSPIDTTVAQSAWNIDTMDGDNDASNPSGITFDSANAHIFVIDFQWLSIGRVRFGLQADGIIHYVHQFQTANTSNIPWTSTPNLPLRYEMITTASSGVASMRCICSTVISEGGIDPVGQPNSHATIDHVNANTADTIYALLGVRLQTAFVGCEVDFDTVSVLSETADRFEWLLIHNPTVAGTFTYSSKTNSCTQVATGSTANPSTNTVTGGHILERGFGETRSESSGIVPNSVMKLGMAVDGTLDEVVLCVRPLGANADIQGALNWRELF